MNRELTKQEEKVVKTINEINSLLSKGDEYVVRSAHTNNKGVILTYEETKQEVESGTFDESLNDLEQECDEILHELKTKKYLTVMVFV